MEETGAAKRVVRIKPNGGRNLERRVSNLEARMQTYENALDAVKANTDKILDVITHGKSVVGFLQKHGGRIVAFAVGIAVTKGVLGQDVAHFITGFFP